MKQFACGDVVPGCTKVFKFRTDAEILNAVAEHARDDHGLSEVPEPLVRQVMANIKMAA